MGGIDAVITIDAEATDEQLEQLKGAVDAHCPMVATLANSVSVETSIIHVNEPAEARLAEDGVKADMVMAVIAAGKEDENALQFEYSSSSKLCGDGLDTSLTMPQGHSLVIDEPSTMPGGNDKGPNPLDLFCAAFGSCQEITY